MTSSYIPGGIGMFHLTHGVWGTVSMIMGSNSSFLKFPCLVRCHAIASSCALIKKRTSFSSSGHKKPNEFIFIFSLLSSVNFSEGMKSGGCYGKTGSEMRGSDGIQLRIQCSSGRVVQMGWTRFAAFLYHEVVRASNGCPLGLGDMLGLADVFGLGGTVGLGAPMSVSGMSNN